MANVGSYGELLALNFMLNTQTATRPVQWGIGLAIGAPTSIAGGEIGAASGYTRAAGQFGAAAAGTVINTLGVTYGPFSAAATISGITVWDTAVGTVNAGNLLWYGTFATAQALTAGQSLIINSAGLTISLS